MDQDDDPEADERQRAVSGWRDQIKRITHDVTYAVNRFRTWDQVRTMWIRNRALDVSDEAKEWIASMHADVGALAVRKQLDRDQNSVSLLRLLDDLERRARFMTIDAHVQDDVNPDLEHLVRHNAKVWVEAGTSHLDPSIPARDRVELEQAGRTAKEWANRSAAHADARGVRGSMTWGDLEDAMRVVERLAIKYAGIIECVCYPAGTGLLWHRQFDESLVFRRPWHKARWRRAQWPDGWAERVGDMEPSFDHLRVEDLSALFHARHAIVDRLRGAWELFQWEPSLLRRILAELDLPDSDSAIMWVRDRLLQRGERWQH